MIIQTWMDGGQIIFWVLSGPNTRTISYKKTQTAFFGRCLNFLCRLRSNYIPPSRLQGWCPDTFTSHNRGPASIVIPLKIPESRVWNICDIQKITYFGYEKSVIFIGCQKHSIHSDYSIPILTIHTFGGKKVFWNNYLQNSRSVHFLCYIFGVPKGNSSYVII